MYVMEKYEVRGEAGVAPSHHSIYKVCVLKGHHGKQDHTIGKGWTLVI